MTRPFQPEPAILNLPLSPSRPLKENLHTHTAFCDGKNTPEEMVLSAIESGFDLLGFSGHSYTSFDESYCMSRQDTIKYIARVRELAQKYQDRITVLCGIEQDYFADEPKAQTYDYDYIIGSVHAFFKPCKLPASSTSSASGKTESTLPPGILPGQQNGKNGYYVYVDFDRRAMEWAIENLYAKDALSLAEDYFEAVSHIHERTGCQIIGHFDLLTKFDQQGGIAPLFDSGHPRYQAAVDKALAALLPTGAVFEINTGAMAKGYRTEPYPAARILKKIQEGGGRITISSDCHAVGKLDFAFDEAVRLARDCGFTSTEILLPGGLWIDQPL